MGTEGYLVLVIIIAVVVLLYGTQLQDFFTNLQQQAGQAQAYAATKTQPKAGQQVCTLDVGFHPFLTSIILVPPTSAQVNIQSGANKIAWIGCTGSVVTNSLVPMPDLYIFNYNTLSLLSFGQISATYNFNAVLVADDGTKIYPILTPVQIKINSITLQSTPLTPYGQAFDVSFTFLHVPRQHYTLQISSPDVGINQQDSGNTYNQNISP